MEALKALLPVMLGGLIGLLGAAIGSVMPHVLKTKTDKRNRKREKLERFVSLAYETRHWIQTNIIAELYGQPSDTRIIPTAEMRMLSLLYLPELKQEVVDLNDYIINFHNWAMEQGLRKRQQGSFGVELLGEQNERYTEVRKLIQKLEKRAEELSVELR